MNNEDDMKDDLSVRMPVPSGDLAVSMESDTAFKKPGIDRPVFSPNNFSLTVDGGLIFFNYLKKFNLIKESNIVTIYPDHSFYFDENDFDGVDTLLVLKRLNLIKDIGGFLRTLDQILPGKLNFVGCFSDFRIKNGSGILSRLSKDVINILDSKTDTKLDRALISCLLEKNRFRLIDMSELDGLIYFYSKHSDKV